MESAPKNTGRNSNVDVVLCKSSGSPGQWFPETEYLRTSAIFVVGTSGIPPNLNYRSVSPIVHPHPVIKSWPLFFIFDSVYILKCIKNNWIGQKDANKCLLFSKFCHNGNHELDSIQSAPFCTLQKLHALESHSVLKYCDKLTSKTLSPTNLER